MLLAFVRAFNEILEDNNVPYDDPEWKRLEQIAKDSETESIDGDDA